MSRESTTVSIPRASESVSTSVASSSPGLRVGEEAGQLGGDVLQCREIGQAVDDLGLLAGQHPAGQAVVLDPQAQVQEQAGDELDQRRGPRPARPGPRR